MYDKLQQKFDQAFKDNSLSMVKHLLEKPAFRQHIDITKHFSIKIEIAFNENQFELVDYLLKQPEVTDELKIKTINDTFCNACCRGNLNLVKELFYNEKYKDYISLAYNDTWCFRTAYSNEKKDVLIFLISEAKLPQDNEWAQREMYNIYPQKIELQTFCQGLFAYTKLSDKLPEVAKNNPIKTKI